MSHNLTHARHIQAASATTLLVKSAISSPDARHSGQQAHFPPQEVEVAQGSSADLEEQQLPERQHSLGANENQLSKVTAVQPDSQ